MVEVMYSLPSDMRDILKKSIGTLVRNDKELLEHISNDSKIVSIGDEITYSLLKNNVKPIFCIIDYMIKRKKYNEFKITTIRSFGNKVVKIDNPAGTITKDLWETIKFVFESNSDSIRIEINGEEDLASLAAIFLAPSDVTIIYGLPNKGALLIEATDVNKNIVKDVLKKM